MLACSPCTELPHFDAGKRLRPRRGNMAVPSMLGNLAWAWHWVVLRGGFAVLFGIFAFLWPGITLAALVLVWGAYAISDGGMALIAAVTIDEEGKPVASLLHVGCRGF